MESASPRSLPLLIPSGRSSSRKPSEPSWSSNPSTDRQDIARLEKEALAAKLAAQEAQDKVREAVLQDKTLQPVNEKVKEEIADDGAWEALLASPMQVDEEFTGPPDAELLAFLQKTLVKPGKDKPVPTSLVSAGDREELLRCQIRGLKNQLASQNAALLASTKTTSDAAERQVDAPSTPPMIRGPPRTPVVGGGRGSAMKPFYNSQATMRDPYQVSPSNNGLTIPTSSEMNQDGYQPIRTPLLSAPVKDMQGKMGKPGKGHSNAGKHAGLRASPLHPSASLEDTITARAMLSDGKGKTTGIQPSNNAVHIAIQDDDHWKMLVWGSKEETPLLAWSDLCDSYNCERLASDEEVVVFLLCLGL